MVPRMIDPAQCSAHIVTTMEHAENRAYRLWTRALLDTKGTVEFHKWATLENDCFYALVRP